MARNICRFTLIELLVVIAIIAILAAMLMPALSQARERATSARCIANLKDSMLGMQMYANDFGGQMPVYISYRDIQTDPENSRYNLTWAGILYYFNYLSDESPVARCPKIGTRMTTDGAVDYRYSCYGAITSKTPLQTTHREAMLYASGNAVRTLVSQRMANPSSFPVLVDTIYLDETMRKEFYGFVTNNTGYGAHARHNRSINIAFAAGNTETVRPTAFRDRMIESGFIMTGARYYISDTGTATSYNIDR